jgi:hypothetical protein
LHWFIRLRGRKPRAAVHPAQNRNPGSRPGTNNANNSSRSARNPNQGQSRSARRRRRIRIGDIVPGMGSMSLGARPIPGGFGGVTQSSPKIHSSGNGAARISHKEYWGEITTNPAPKVEGGGSVSADATRTDKVYFTAGRSGAKFLDSFSALFERYTVSNLVVHYRTSVGTAKDGSIVVGCDWDINQTAQTTFADVSVLNPNRRVAVWQDFDLPIPSHKLMTRKYYRTAKTADPASEENTCLVLYWSVRGSAATTYGDLWVSYDVLFEGPRTLN